MKYTTPLTALAIVAALGLTTACEEVKDNPAGAAALEAEVTTAPEATVAATEAPEATEAPTTTTTAAPTTTTTPEPELPYWATPEMAQFADDGSDFMTEVTDLSDRMSKAMTAYDVPTATDLAIELWIKFQNAPEVPGNAPFADTYNEMIAQGVATYDLVSDALIEMDPDKLTEATGMLNDLTDLIVVYTDELKVATDELNV